ncbi:hypothetical protein BG003_008569 [Podila horticola]|nr:hypothetical protein BG003_008569 [Podila horticola]
MPGINDSALSEENYLPFVLKALEVVSSIHLVVFTVANSPFTEGLMDAFRTHLNLLSEFSRNIAYVHTKVDYAKLHPQEEQFCTRHGGQKAYP